MISVQWELSHYAFQSLYRVGFPNALTLPLLPISYCLNIFYRYLLCPQIFHEFLTARLTDRQVRAAVIATFSKKRRLSPFFLRKVPIICPRPLSIMGNFTLAVKGDIIARLTHPLSVMLTYQHKHDLMWRQFIVRPGRSYLTWQKAKLINSTEKGGSL